MSTLLKSRRSRNKRRGRRARKKKVAAIKAKKRKPKGKGAKLGCEMVIEVAGQIKKAVRKDMKGLTGIHLLLHPADRSF